jgi:hypothetical protein
VLKSGIIRTSLLKKINGRKEKRLVKSKKILELRLPLKQLKTAKWINQ